ncbi:MAG: DNA topoisomerase III [Verrucomicrobiales bacterium]|nr:DNA topoisomerase III [Verrucomicrobiales bacterium]
MSKTLIIAEKPSVATDLARVLGKDPAIGKFEKNDEFYENDRYLISSAVGHLVQQALPTTAEGKNLPWNFDCLPVLPVQFALEPSEQKGGKSRLSLLKKLMKRKDVTELINACDAGREGELIFRYIVQYCEVSKPVRRLWMQSMTDGSIRESFAHLRSDEEMRPLADAAYCRSESDWLIGINSTRAMTAFNSKFGGFNKTPVGRVQTPTLALLAEREQEIEDFVSEDFFEVHGSFDVAAGTYPGRWYDPTFKKSEDKPHARAERLWNKTLADAIVARCHGKTAVVEEKKKPTKQIAPQLYDLTSLQREANGRFGFSARRTLQLAQSLYERHKALTYPRTDSRYLPDDYVTPSITTLEKIAAASGRAVSDMPAFAAKAVQSKWVTGSNRRVFDGGKVSDHFAIIPTGQIPQNLDEAEQKLYDMVTRRFIAAFYPQAEFENTTRISLIGEDNFKTEGKILVEAGWLAVYGKTVGAPTPAAAPDDEEDEGKRSNGDRQIVAVKPGETAKATEVDALAKVTRPPARYNESTLLSAMETAGKRVDDEDLRDAMSERGLGTPATRASTIEGLILDKYITRDGRDLFVTTRGMRLIEQLHNMEIGILTSPEMTGEWEYKLKQMEQGRLDRSTFMHEIKALTGNVVDAARDYAKNAVEREWPEFPVPCPVCGAASLAQDDGRYKCRQPECKFTLPKVVASRPLSTDEAKTLLSTKLVGPLTGFVNRFKLPFDAAIELVEDKKSGLKASFVFEKTPEEEIESESILPENELCPCPLCDGGKIYVTPGSYICNRRVSGDGCKARLSREMCKFEIPREQAIKYFTQGKTDIIDKWISKRGRPFQAALTCNATGKRMLGWEFPPREPAKKKVVGDGTAPAKKAPSKKAASKKAPTKKAASKKD